MRTQACVHACLRVCVCVCVCVYACVCVHMYCLLEHYMHKQARGRYLGLLTL